MRALVKAKTERGLWLEDVSLPEPGPEEVLIEVRHTALCGTDLHIYRWDEWASETIPVPMVVGHEFFGTVADIGSEVTGFQPGDRVSGEGHITCGHCRNCRAGRRHLCREAEGIGVDRPGAFGEYLVMPEDNAFLVPDDISDDIATILDPLGNATHTALAFDLVGEDVLITGAGPIGLMAAAISLHVGARFVVVTDLNPFRLELAGEFGVSRAVDARSLDLAQVMDDLGMLEGFDVGMEMSGSPDAFRDMLEVMIHGGRVAVLGIPTAEMSTDWKQIIFKGLTVQGIYGREIFESWYKMTSMLQSGLDIRPVITHHFPVEQFEEAFAVVSSGRAGKVLLDWT
ncbi:MAG: L-threonine 3-dehydrogenase [Acidimicrobiia bacterium]